MTTPFNQQTEEIEHTSPQVEETPTTEQEWELKTFLSTLKIHHKELKDCFNDALAEQHILDLCQQAAEEATLKERARCLDDMFLEIAKLAEPDERQPSAGDLHTNMDEIHKIRDKIKNG